MNHKKGKSMSKTYIFYRPITNEKESHHLTHLALKEYLLENGLEYKDMDPDIHQDEKHSKPYFKNYPGIYHNTTHSGNWWACAIGSVENGLDLQRKTESKTEKVARRFLHPAELAWLQEYGMDHFFQIWAYNESYIKYTGDGLTKGLDYFSVVSPKRESVDNMAHDSEKEQSLGVTGVHQQEISFPQKDYWMVLTTEKETEVVLRELCII